MKRFSPSANQRGERIFMFTRDETLDLTGLNRYTFMGKIRVRHIADWAHDYWEKGYKLSQIKMHRELYEELKHDWEDSFAKMAKNPLDITTIDLGHGPIELTVV